MKTLTVNFSPAPQSWASVILSSVTAHNVVPGPAASTSLLERRSWLEMQNVISYLDDYFQPFFPSAKSKERHAVFNLWNARIKLNGGCKKSAEDLQFVAA